MIGVRTRVTRARLSRRAFLRTVGASAALLPLLDVERAPAAAPSGFPKRLVTIAWSNGVSQSSFYPLGDDPTTNTILQPMAPFAAKTTLVTGINYQSMIDHGFPVSGHFSYPTMFTGTYKNVGGENATATGPSIDQVVADAVARTIKLQVRLLNVTVQGKSTSYRADGTRDTGESDPARLFQTLFGSQALPPERLEALRARRQSVLDYVVGELSTFGARLGTDDRAKVSAHLESVRQLETALSTSPGSAGDPACAGVDPGAPTTYQTSLKAFSDLVATALRCDVTRTVSLVWADENGSAPYELPFLNLGGSTMDIGEVHDYAHQGGPPKLKIDTWYMTQLAYLARALDTVPEGGGTTLDNSLVVMGNAMGEGSHHNVTDVPFILVGSAGGALRTGRTVRSGTWQGPVAGTWSGVGTPDLTSTQLLAEVGTLKPVPPGTDRGSAANNHLLASISNLMDVPATGFGAGYSGTLTEL
jgi:hypothetical protein